MSKIDVSELLHSNSGNSAAPRPDFSEVLIQPRPSLLDNMTATASDEQRISSNGLYKVGSLRPANSDPEIDPKRMQLAIKKDQSDSAVTSIYSDLAVVGTGTVLHSIAGGNARQAIAKEFAFLNKFGHSTGDTSGFKLNMKWDTEILEDQPLRDKLSMSVASRDSLYKENLVVENTASKIKSSAFKTLGAAVLTDAALNMFCFKDSVSSVRTLAMDAIVPLALIATPANKLGLGLKVGAIASAHLINRYLDYKMEH